MLCLCGQQSNLSPKVLWMTQCTIARGCAASGDSGWGSSTALSAIELTVASVRHEIVVLLPSKCMNKFTFCQEAPHLL